MTRGREGCFMCKGDGGWRDSFGWVECPCLDAEKLQAQVRQRIATYKAPKPLCQVCGGRGGTRAGGKWIKCVCTKTTKEERELTRFLNSAGARSKPTQQSLF